MVVGGEGASRLRLTVRLLVGVEVGVGVPELVDCPFELWSLLWDLLLLRWLEEEVLLRDRNWLRKLSRKWRLLLLRVVIDEGWSPVEGVDSLVTESNVGLVVDVGVDGVSIVGLRVESVDMDAEWVDTSVGGIEEINGTEDRFQILQLLLPVLFGLPSSWLDDDLDDNRDDKPKTGEESFLSRVIRLLKVIPLGFFSDLEDTIGHGAWDDDDDNNKDEVVGKGDEGLDTLRLPSKPEDQFEPEFGESTITVLDVASFELNWLPLRFRCADAGWEKVLRKDGFQREPNSGAELNFHRY